MNRRLSAIAIATLFGVSVAMVNVATPAHAGDVRALIFPTPTDWGLGKSGWTQTLAYLDGHLVKVPCRNALRCNSVVFAHMLNGKKNGELLEQAFRGNAVSANFNYNGSVAGFVHTGLKVRKNTYTKQWRITILNGMATPSPFNGKAVVVEWKGPGNNHRVVAIEYLAPKKFLASHPLSMATLLKGAMSMAAPTGGAVTLLTDV